MVLQSLKSLFPHASEEVLIEVMNDLEKSRGKDMSGLELFDWMNQLVMVHTIADALNSNTKDDSKPSEVGASRPLLLRMRAMNKAIEEL